MECRAARGTEEDGEGRLQSPWRSSMDRLQGESIDETSPPASDCSPSNLNTQAGHDNAAEALCQEADIMSSLKKWNR